MSRIIGWNKKHKKSRAISDPATNSNHQKTSWLSFSEYRFLLTKLFLFILERNIEPYPVACHFSIFYR